MKKKKPGRLFRVTLKTKIEGRLNRKIREPLDYICWRAEPTLLGAFLTHFQEMAESLAHNPGASVRILEIRIDTVERKTR